MHPIFLAIFTGSIALCSFSQSSNKYFRENIGRDDFPGMMQLFSEINEKDTAHTDGYIRVSYNQKGMITSYHMDYPNHLSNPSQAVHTRFLFDTEGRYTGAIFLDFWGNQTTKDETFEHRYKLDEAGRIIERHHLDRTGMPVADITGSYGQRYQYDELNRVVSCTLLNQSGNKLKNESVWVFRYTSNGKVSEKKILDHRGLLSSISSPNVEYAYDGNLLIQERHFNSLDEHFATVDHKYDEFGNRIETKYTDANGTLKNYNYSDIAIIYRQYDAFGRMTKEQFFDENENMLESSAATKVYLYNDIGNLLRITDYLTTDVQDDSAKGLIKDFTYDEFGRLLQSCTLGFDNKPYFEDSDFFNENHPCKEFTYDGQGNIAEIKHCSGLNCMGQCMYNFIIRFVYDANHRKTEMTFLNEQGKLLEEGGFTEIQTAMTRWKYDESGNIIEESYYNHLGELTLHPQTYKARVNRKFDDHNRLIEEYSLDEKNELIPNIFGAHKTRFSYDRYGNCTEEAYVDADNMPLQHAVAYRRTGYNDKHQVVYQTDADANGNCYTEYEQICKTTYGYNEKNLISEIAYFGPDNKPLSSYQGAIIRYLYDEWDRIIETKHFDENGALSDAFTGYAVREEKFDNKDVITQLTLRDKDNNIIQSDYYQDYQLYKSETYYPGSNCLKDRMYYSAEKITKTEHYLPNDRFGYTHITVFNAGEIESERWLNESGQLTNNEQGYAFYSAIDRIYRDEKGKKLSPKQVIRILTSYVEFEALSESEEPLGTSYYSADGKPAERYGVHLHNKLNNKFYDLKGNEVIRTDDYYGYE
jgi:hypothetical protein